IPGAKGSQAPETYERFAEVAQEMSGPVDVAGLNQSGIALLANAPEAINRLEKAEDVGINSLSCWFRMGGMEHRKVMKAMKRYATEVLPYFKAVREKQKVGQ